MAIQLVLLMLTVEKTVKKANLFTMYYRYLKDILSINI